MMENILYIVLIIGATILFVALSKLIMVVARWIEKEMESEE